MNKLKNKTKTAYENIMRLKVRIKNFKRLKSILKF